MSTGRQYHRVVSGEWIYLLEFLRRVPVSCCLRRGSFCHRQGPGERGIYSEKEAQWRKGKVRRRVQRWDEARAVRGTEMKETKQNEYNFFAGLSSETEVGPHSVDGKIYLVQGASLCVSSLTVEGRIVERKKEELHRKKVQHCRAAEQRSQGLHTRATGHGGCDSKGSGNI
jgi:hypothetical protein